MTKAELADADVELQRQIEEKARKDEENRLILAEVQKEQAFRCWHHIMTSNRVRDDVRQCLLMLQPEAVAYGKEKIEAELAALTEAKEEASKAGFVIPTTPAEVARHETPKRKGRR